VVLAETSDDAREPSVVVVVDTGDDAVYRLAGEELIRNRGVHGPT